MSVFCQTVDELLLVILSEIFLVSGKWPDCWILGKCMWFWIPCCLGFDISAFRDETKASSSNVNIVNCRMVSRFLDSRKLYVVLDSILPRI